MEEKEEKIQKKEKRTFSGTNVYAIIITIGFVFSMAAVIFFMVTDKNEEENETVEVSADTEHVYTAKDLASLIEEQRKLMYEEAYSEAENKLLADIKDKMSTGTGTLGLLRGLYPEYLVYNEVGGYVFGEILDIPKNNFVDGDFEKSSSNGILSYVGNEDIKTYKTIDVSKFQGNIDWEAVKDDGVEYVFIRVGIRGYGTGAIVEEEKLEDNIKGALAAELKVGVYFFSEAINEDEAVEEAKFVLKKIKGYDIELPVVMDIEEIPDADARNEALTKNELTNVAKTFMETIEEAGYHAMLYGNIKCLVSMVDLEKLTDYDIWYAYYSDEIYIPYSVAGWQYSNKGKVSGINTDCDLNIFFKEWD